MKYALILDWREKPKPFRAEASTFAKWVIRMEGAGWRLWIQVDDPYLFCHADEHRAALTMQEACAYYRTNTIPDPYAVLREVGER